MTAHHHRKLRTLTVLAFLAITAVGLGAHVGTGTLSAFGYKSISLVCPLGSLETMLASRSFLPRAFVSLLVIFVLSILLGRVFCAWICPVPLLRSWLVGHSKSNGNGAVASVERNETSDSHQSGKPSRIVFDSRHFVLGGALLSSAVFGFPVFCLVCPIGLTFATLIGLWRLLQFNEPTWTLLIFPAVLVLELVVLRKWCRKICPLGALVSLLSSLNIFDRPEVDSGTCLCTANRVDCKICKNACNEGIDLHHAQESRPLSECTKCRECSNACPVNAITFPFFRKKKEVAKC